MNLCLYNINILQKSPTENTKCLTESIVKNNEKKKRNLLTLTMVFFSLVVFLNIGEYINFIQVKIQNRVKLFWSTGSTPIGLNKKMPLVRVLKDFLNIFF